MHCSLKPGRIYRLAWVAMDHGMLRQYLTRSLLAVVCCVVATACSTSTDEAVTIGEAPEAVDTVAACQHVKDVDITIELCEVVEPVSGEIHPLMLQVAVESPMPVDVVLTATSTSDNHRVSTGSSGSTASHRLILAGLRAEQSYDIEVSWDGSGGLDIGGEVGFSHDSGALPADLPDVTLLTGEPELMQPGITVFPVISTPEDYAEPVDPPPGYTQGLALGVDEAGEIVWFARHRYPIGDLRQTAKGTFIASVDDTSAVEFDLMGRTLREWTGRFNTRAGLTGTALGNTDVREHPKVSEQAIRIDTDTIHHELELTDDDQLLFLSTELRELHFDEPQCTGEHGEPHEFNGVYGLVGDVVVWADAETGEILQEFSLLDILDPQTDTELLYHCPPGHVLRDLYTPDYPNSIDWTHGNAIELDEERNLVWISLFYLDAVVGLRLNDDDQGVAGELVHWLGPTRPTLELVGDGQWHFAQHAPELQPNGNLLIYDNGNGRTQGMDDANDFTRTVEYSIDLQAGTIEQVWEYISQKKRHPRIPSLRRRRRPSRQRQRVNHRRLLWNAVGSEPSHHRSLTRNRRQQRGMGHRSLRPTRHFNDSIPCRPD